MTAREHILGQLRDNARGDAAPPAPWQSRRQFDDMAARFIASLEKVKGAAYRVASLDVALDKLGELLQTLEAERIVVNNEAPFDTLDLPGRWPEAEWHTVGQAGDLRAACAAADVGLSSADAALAETGTLVLSSGPGRSRLVTLLPPVHIALVPAACLTPDIFTWTATRHAAGLADAMPANLILVSGPSKTADIEQTLAVGVHGPKRFIVVLYD
ncbi:MAG: hypothetical protein GYB65_07220 [Chloroflexi bacterium]|nr:hypothetical protein [Chloroflexota bacterium]